VPYEVSTRLCAQPGLTSECFGARESLDIRPVAPVEALGSYLELGEESDTDRT